MEAGFSSTPEIVSGVQIFAEWMRVLFVVGGLTIILVGVIRNKNKNQTSDDQD